MPKYIIVFKKNTSIKLSQTKKFPLSNLNPKAIKNHYKKSIQVSQNDCQLQQNISHERNVDVRTQQTNRFNNTNLF